MTQYYDLLESPIGLLLVACDDSGAVTHLYTKGAEATVAGWPDAVRDPERCAAVREQIEEYFGGKRRSFDLPLNPRGTPFQKSVWAALVEIPFGETRSYGQLAVQLGNPGASRAVGRANATNPISIIVPCHRVIGSAGALTGYAGGLSIKEKLLALEGGLPQAQRTLL